MRWVTRIHEFLADHISWIQYPKVQLLPLRVRRMSGKQRAWLITGAFWLFVILFSVYGNLIR